ncbi:MAG TPA: SBBP repeat-containing protein [Ignavibacteriaceae bacterium]|nr:SBBP repeat-containing protein [Ignavibacteriaceae bacterium]
MKERTLLRGSFLIAILIVIIALPINAQIKESWAVRYDNGGVDKSNAIGIDDFGNVFITGSSNSAGVGTEDYLTIKYNSAGSEEWTSRINGSGGSVDIAYALVIDSSGSIIITGGSVGSGSGYDYFTIKYSSAGDTLWTRRYNGPKNSKDIAYSIALDDSQNIFITGESEGLTGTHGIFEDYATVKYNPAGDFQWAARYNGPAGDYDKANSICVDTEGNIYVTGVSDGGSSGSGDPHFDYATIKYNSAGLTQWIRRYNSSNGEDEGVMVKADELGNIFVTGFSSDVSTFADYATINYSADGDTTWISRYNGPASNDDRASSLAVDNLGNVFVTGKSYGGSITNYDYTTIKYNSLGDSVWVNRYNGGASDIDGASAVSVDKSGNVYVTGYSTNISTAFDYATMKYNTDGDLSWIINYTNSDFSGSSDEPFAMFVDASGIVYVTGMSALDYAAIKYVPIPVSVENSPRNIPNQFALEQNYPNPFNPTTKIKYTIPSVGTSLMKFLQFVQLKVYDVIGNEVATLVNEEKPAGSYEVTFDASQLSSGIYFYTLKAGSFTETKKMAMMK